MHGKARSCWMLGITNLWPFKCGPTARKGAGAELPKCLGMSWGRGGQQGSLRVLSVKKGSISTRWEIKVWTPRLFKCWRFHLGRTAHPKPLKPLLSVSNQPIRQLNGKCQLCSCSHNALRMPYSDHESVFQS